MEFAGVNIARRITIGKLLGQIQIQTTARYAYIAAEPVKAAAGILPGRSVSERAGAAVEQGMMAETEAYPNITVIDQLTRPSTANARPSNPHRRSAPHCRV